MIPLLGVALLASSVASVHSFGDGTRIDLALDGPVLGWTATRDPSGGRRILLLVGAPPPAKPPAVCGVESVVPVRAARTARLFLWDPARPDALPQVGADLPSGSLAAVDLDADGVDELVVFGESGIEELLVDDVAGSTAVRVLTSEGAAVAGGSEAGDTVLRTVSIGALTTYRRGADGSVRAATQVELPIRVEPSATRVRLASRGVEILGRLADGRMRLATPPEPIGVERLRTLLLDPDGPVDGRTIEAWARFPSGERMLDYGFLTLDGRPVLVVTTIAADKLSLFGEKKLRVFPLQPDRTRTGVPPLAAAETGINLWQAATPFAVDVDADGRDDLVLAYFKGLKDTIVALEVRRGSSDGSLLAARRFDFDVPEGDRGFLEYGQDLDGDGRPDLVLRAGGSLTVFGGTPPEKALDRPVAKVASRRIPLPADLPTGGRSRMSFSTGGFSVEHDATEPGSPRFLDLDADGRPEAIFVGSADGAGRLVIVRIR